MDKTKPFGLLLPKRAQKIPVKTNAAFGSDSDDEPFKKKAFTKIPQAKPLSKKVLKVEQCEDPSIYEYDSIYDDMKAKQVEKTAPKAEKPSRYISSLLKAADKRKKNYERRLDKKVQVEREKEGDKFKDKEAFVTSAYKKKMQEMEEEEERERRESQLNDMMDVTKQKDLSGFYRHFLKQSVGEEKIPVFGEKIEIKKEPGTESDPKLISESVDECSQNDIPDSNVDRDSDIVSSSDDEDSGSKEGLNSVEKSQMLSKNNHNKSDEYRIKTQKTKPHRQIRKKTVEHSSSDDELESIKTSLTRPQRQLRKKTDDDKDSSDDLEIKTEDKSHGRKRKIDEDADSESSNGSDSPDEVHQEPETKTNDSVKEHDSELKTDQERKNIYKKRTVDAVFAEAQARYFQRMAARSA